ncbi:MAG: pirin family protein [Alphaproteobacteria bacterium]
MGMKIHDRDLRGKTKTGWLDSAHTFSFGYFMDPERMGFGPLRVINDDRIIGGSGFPTHPHDNMEIITLVLEGALEHKDSMGTGSVIKAGEIQKMSAGSGVTHSEFNASQSENGHFYQIWIIPDKRDIAPMYQQMSLQDAPELPTGWKLIGQHSGTGDSAGVIDIQQDVKLYYSKAPEGAVLEHNFLSGRRGFLQILRGAVKIDSETLKEGDGLEMTDQDSIKLHIVSDNAELLLFDMA